MACHIVDGDLDVGNVSKRRPDGVGDPAVWSGHLVFQPDPQGRAVQLTGQRDIQWNDRGERPVPRRALRNLAELEAPSCQFDRRLGSHARRSGHQVQIGTQPIPLISTGAMERHGDHAGVWVQHAPERRFLQNYTFKPRFIRILRPYNDGQNWLRLLARSSI